MKTLPLIGLCALTMVLFAANSILTRAALAEGAIGAGQFAQIRLAAGALVLVALLGRRGVLRGVLHWGHLPSAAALFAYMLGFSISYQWLEAGLGALILFGGVQITMFAGALISQERVPPARWAGMAVALMGLALLTLPGARQPDPIGAAFMTLAAIGWGVFSLLGRKAGDPLTATGASFVWAAIAMALIPFGFATESSPRGVALAIVAGAVTSGMGYALWYRVLPHLAASRAAALQLSVPVLTLIAGALLLSEPLSLRAVCAAGLVVGGVLVALRAR